MTRVLVVDDQVENRYLLDVLLTSLGYEVILANNGEEALSNARESPPDVIVTDILMPVMDGFALCREWRADEQLRDIPLIFYTATYTDPEDEELAIRLGADRYLVKPAEPHVLAQTIVEVLQKSRTTMAPGPERPFGEEMELFRQHNRVLFRKLECKMAALEREVAERWRVELALRESQGFLESIVENIPDMVFVKEAQGLRFVRFNRAGEELLGFPRAELSGKSDYDFFPREEADFFTERDREVLSTKRVLDIAEETIQTRHRGTRVLHTKKIPILDDDGNPRYLLGISEDITERKKVQEALRESEERYRALVAQSPDGVFLVDLKGRFLSVNETICHELGFSETEMLAMFISDIVSEKQWEIHEAQLAKLLKGERLDGTAEYVFRTKGGALVPVEVRSAPHRKGAEIVGFQAIARDITERKRTEQALRVSETRFELLAEVSPVGIFQTDHHGATTYVNRRWTEISGLPAEQALGDGWLQAVHPDDRKSLADGWGGATQSGRTSGAEYRFLRPDGAIAWVIGQAVPVCDGSGHVDGFVGTITDITDRVRAESALRESEERYRKFFEENITANYISRPDGTLVDCNPAFVRLFGFRDLPEALATCAVELYPDPGARERVLALLNEDREVRYHEMELRRLDGKPLTVIANLVGRFDDHGRLTAVQGYLFDATETRRLEAQLLRAQRMETVGRLAGGVAHDFNNLLQVILGLVEVMRSSTDSLAARHRLLAELEEHAMRGAQLTRQLLLFSRCQAAQSETLDLNQVVDGLARMLRRLLRESVALSVELGPGPLAVEGDHSQLEQVLMNLVVNASEAMPLGGRLTIRTRCEGEQLVLEVADTGCGIPAELLPSVFDPFFTTKENGTGLGLSVVHGVVTRAGGTVEAASRPGEGTTFVVHLPRSASTSSPRLEGVSTQTPTAAAGKGRVLVVEDDPGVRFAVQKLLSGLGYEVATAESGRAVQELSADEPFDVVLCDQGLPDTTGVELLAVLCNRWPDTVRILMSGHAEDNLTRGRVATGAHRFLSKPFTASDLGREIQAALATRDGPRPAWLGA